jgi:uncharacterized protein YceH (UPF0502 family)
MELTPEELRVLGSLVEKELTTPEQYPLTLNALVLACNQRSNREPVVNLSEETVQSAVTSAKTSRLCGSCILPTGARCCGMHTPSRMLWM